MEQTTPSIEAKQKAQEYLDGLGICPLIQDVLNDICRHPPVDPYGYIAEELKKSCPSPTISKVEARTALHADGSAAIQVDVFCNLHGSCDMHCARATVPYTQSNRLPASPQEIGVEDTEPSFPQDVQHYSSITSTLVKNCDPTDQDNIDHLLSKESLLKVVGENTTKAELSNFTLATSFAVIMASHKIGGTQPYQDISKLCGTHINITSLPTLVMPGLSCRQSLGKLAIKSIEFVAPLNVSSIEAVSSLLAVHMGLRTIISEKCGVVGSTLTGELCAAIKIDKMDQALDLVKEAIKKCEGAKPRVILNIDASICWNNDKNKYELIQGQLKPPEDLVKEYVALASNPIVLGFVNPFKLEHTDAWVALKEALTKDQVLCCNDNAAYVDDAEDDKEDEDGDEDHTDTTESASESVLVKSKQHQNETKGVKKTETEETPPKKIKMAEMCTSAMITSSVFGSVSQIVAAGKTVSRRNLGVYFSTEHLGRNTTELAADLAIGTNSVFFNVGSDKAHNLNRYLEIEAEVRLHTKPSAGDNSS